MNIVRLFVIVFLFIFGIEIAWFLFTGVIGTMFAGIDYHTTTVLRLGAMIRFAVLIAGTYCAIALVGKWL